MKFAFLTLPFLLAASPVVAEDYACFFDRMCVDQDACKPTAWRVSLLQQDDEYLLKDDEGALPFQVLASGHGNLHLSHVPNPGTAFFISRLADGSAFVTTHIFFMKAGSITHTGRCEAVEE